VKPRVLGAAGARALGVAARGQGAERAPHGGRSEIDPRKRRVSRGDKKIDLTAKEFALLDCLVRNCGEVMSRTLIASRSGT